MELGIEGTLVEMALPRAVVGPLDLAPLAREAAARGESAELSFMAGSMGAVVGK
jgi:hypothetical protein